MGTILCDRNCHFLSRHEPAHFHAVYGEYEITVEIEGEAKPAMVAESISRAYLEPQT